jgi:hypothetical protein
VLAAASVTGAFDAWLVSVAVPDGAAIEGAAATVASATLRPAAVMAPWVVWRIFVMVFMPYVSGIRRGP